MRYLCLSIFYGAFFYGVVMDIKTKTVYRFVWWIAGAAGMATLLLSREMETGRLAECLGEIIIFGVIQYAFFARMYGLADCHAFVCCSFLLGSMGGTMREYVLQMLIAVLLLGIVQACRGNINRRGNLRQPVAFLPYIAAAFFIMVFQLSTCTFLGFLV